MAEVLIVPAAGAGSRLGSEGPKLLAPVGGRAMIDWILDLYRQRVERAIVVIHPSAESAVRAHFGSNQRASNEPAVELAFQERRTGMLDAILAPAAQLEAGDLTGVWVTWCDQVAMLPETIDAVAAAARDEPDAAVVLPTMRRRDPYIHIERAEDGAITNVLHAREGDPMPDIGESDMGLFRLSARAYRELLPEFSNHVVEATETGERNFLPFLAWLRGRAATLCVAGHHDMEAQGVNTPEDRQRIEEYWARG